MKTYFQTATSMRTRPRPSDICREVEAKQYACLHEIRYEVFTDTTEDSDGEEREKRNEE